MLAKEFGWSWNEFLAQEPSRTNAFFAAACEMNGMKGTGTYADKEIAANIHKIAQDGDTVIIY